MVSKKHKTKSKSLAINYDFLGTLSSCLSEYIKGKLSALDIVLLLEKKIPQEEKPLNYNPRKDFEGYELIESFLELRGMTQIELSKKINMSPSKLNDIIKARVKISPKTARKLARIFKVDHTLFL